MNKKSLQALAEFEEQVERRVAAGNQAFVVSIYLMAGGIAMYKMAEMEEAAQQLLLDHGLAVTGMERRDWEYKTYFEVRVPQAAPPRSAEKDCPRCAETIKAAAIVCRFCGHEFGDLSSAPARQQVAAQPPAVRPPSIYSALPENRIDPRVLSGKFPRVGTLMCPTPSCDEGGLRTEDSVCGLCGAQTIPWE